MSGSHRPLQCSLGTAWVGNFILPPGISGASPYQLAIASPLGPGKLIIQPLLSGNTAWDWGLKTFLDSLIDKALVKAEAIFRERLLPPTGLTVFPWFMQPNPFIPGEHGAGAIMGLNADTEAADLVRALAASMVFELVRVLEALKVTQIIDRVITTGGASQGSYFIVLMAALFAPVPVFIQEGEETSVARGALYPLNRKVAHAPVRKIKSPPENVKTAILRAYDAYRLLFERIYGSVQAGKPFRWQKHAGRAS